MEQNRITQLTMAEPYLSEFRKLIRCGASTRDIHDSTGQGSYDKDIGAISTDAYVDFEVQRVQVLHRKLCPLLLKHVGSAPEILDVGCGTGAVTVALASCGLGAARIVGIDANESVLKAARVRKRGHRISDDQVSFSNTTPGRPLIFPDNSFDLVTCVSMLEFIHDTVSREAMIGEFIRVVRPGGFIFLATPNDLTFRECHSRKILGNFIHRPGYPWASSRRSIKNMFKGCDDISISRSRMEQQPRFHPFLWAASLLEWTFPWQQFLMQKRPPASGTEPTESVGKMVSSGLGCIYGYGAVLGVLMDAV